MEATITTTETMPDWTPFKEPVARTIKVGRVVMDSVLLRMWNELEEMKKPAAPVCQP